MSDYVRYRLYEILPGALTWGVLVLGVALSFAKPLWVIYFIIVFDIYWVYRVLYFSLFLVVSWRRLRQTLAVDWMARLRAMAGWSQAYHLVFLPMYNEDVTVVRATLRHIADGTYPADHLMVVLAGEARKHEHFAAVAAAIQQEFGQRFFRFWVTEHPADLSDEVPGKGSNLYYAGHAVKRHIDALGMPYERIIVSSFDVDTIVHPQYFAHLTHEYLAHPDPTHTSFQPIALYNNNMWESPSVLRIMSFGTTFWLLFALARPDTITTFSSHSMSFKALVDVGFWQKDVVSEDSRIFLQAFLRYRGRYRVHPLYVPVSMDTVRDDTWWVSIKNLYKQQRRWGWGVEHVPYLLWHFHRMGDAISWRLRFKQVWYQLEGKFSWATTALILLVFGRLPLWVAGDAVRRTALFQNTPHILEWLMVIAMFGLVISMTLSLTLLPRAPQHVKKHTMVFMVLQWVLLPVSLIFVSAIPAIDAQTHLMLGRYLGFNVSQKKRAYA
ncbi:MAG: hypothetical protein AAB633_01950 [Patescibacteria group bacterium]